MLCVIHRAPVLFRADGVLELGANLPLSHSQRCCCIGLLLVLNLIDYASCKLTVSVHSCSSLFVISPSAFDCMLEW